MCEEQQGTELAGAGSFRKLSSLSTSFLLLFSPLLRALWRPCDSVVAGGRMFQHTCVTRRDHTQVDGRGSERRERWCRLARLAGRTRRAQWLLEERDAKPARVCRAATAGISASSPAKPLAHPKG